VIVSLPPLINFYPVYFGLAGRQRNHWGASAELFGLESSMYALCWAHSHATDTPDSSLKNQQMTACC
jgi:hypothetical protein